MKKKIIVTFLAILTLVLFCSCEEKASQVTEEVTLTYTDIYEANAYSAVTSNHSSIHLKDSALVNGKFAECEYYWNESGFANATYPYEDAEGNSVRDITYISDEGVYLYFRPTGTETEIYDMLTCYAESGFTTVESASVFGLISPEYKQTITECKKTDTGYEITGENRNMSYVPMFYSAFFSDGEAAFGDKIQFKMVLNEKYEMLKYENYYVFADGRESVKASFGEFVYDGNEEPDFMKEVNSVLEKSAKDISVKIYTENEVAERKVYSDAFLLYTDYEVYSDAEYNNPMTADNGCFMFDTSDDIAVYLKTSDSE